MHKLLTFLILLLPGIAAADAFDDLVASKMMEQRIPGLAFAVVYKGKVVMARGYGQSDVAAHVNVSPDTKFQIASLSKPVIATAVMMLVEEGKCRLEDQIGKYVEGLPPGWSRVPIRNLLNHTSGIGEFRSGLAFRKNGGKDVPFQELVAAAAPETSFEVADHFEYSNTNYLLLGQLIASISKKPYTDFVRDRIFKPLGMSSSSFIGEDVLTTRGYQGRSTNFSPMQSCTLAWAGPGASIVSTVGDLAKFTAALESPKLLKGASLNQMLEPFETRFGKSDYGLGWGLAQLGKTSVALHSGKMNGFSSIIVRLLDPRITVIVLTNAAEIDGNTIARGILGCYYPELDAKKLTPTIDEEPEVTREHSRILRSILSGKPDMAAFTENYKAHITEEKLKVAGAELARGGRLQPMQVLQRYRLSPRDIHVYLVTIGRTQLIVTFFLLDGGKVDGLKFAAP